MAALQRVSTVAVAARPSLLSLGGILAATARSPRPVRWNSSSSAAEDSEPEAELEPQPRRSGSGSSFRVAELFPSIQGEGPFTGRPSLFVRLGVCNLRCAWCDTKYTWMFSEQIMGRMRADIPESLQHRFLGPREVPGAAVEASAAATAAADYDPDAKSLCPSRPYSKAEELRRLSLQELLAEIQENLSPGMRTVIFTGGEPLLHRQALTRLIPQLYLADRERYLQQAAPPLSFEFETNGTLPPLDRAELAIPTVGPHIHYNVSPKLANSFQPERLRLKPEVLSQFLGLTGADSSCFKFVVDQAERDLPEIFGLLERLDAPVPRDRVWLMPQGSSAQQLADLGREVAELCVRHGFRYSHRVHVALWGDQRGV